MFIFVYRSVRVYLPVYTCIYVLRKKDMLVFIHICISYNISANQTFKGGFFINKRRHRNNVITLTTYTYHSSDINMKLNSI